MESKIAATIALEQKPVALRWSDQTPEEAVQFKEQKWGCIVRLARSWNDLLGSVC